MGGGLGWCLMSCGLVIVVQTESVDVRDVGVAGEMVAHGHPMLGFIPVNSGMEATQTPDVPPIKLQLSSNKTKKLTCLKTVRTAAPMSCPIVRLKTLC